MIAVALKGLAGRKVRALLTAFAVVIGVSMVSGTYVLTDTMQKAFDGIFTASYDDTDAVIAGKEIVKGSSSGNAHGARLAAREGAGAARGRARPAARSAGTTRPRPRSSAATARRSAPAARPPRPRLRRRATPVQPAEAAVGRLAAGPEPGRHRRRHGRGGELQGRRLRRRLHLRRAAPLPGDRGRDVRRRRLARRRPPWPSSTCARRRSSSHKEGVYDGISITAKEGTSPAELVRGGAAARAREPRGQGQRAAGRRAGAGDQRGPVLHPLLPARLRRHRAVRRRVRHLQHALDHRRAAHPRVRDAADPRRLAQAGHALGRHRGPRHRAAGLGHRAVRSASASPRA